MNTGNKKTILLVEDEEIVAMMGKMTLENFGYDVITANTGENAVETVEKNSIINMILMDIDLGNGIDGTQAAEIILRNHDIPVVFLSSHIEPEIVEKTEKITSYGYVVKNSGNTVLDASIKMAFKLFDVKEKIKCELIERKRIEEDLRVHQVELKMQNEELRCKQEELETMRSKFFDLYDLAPVSYLTINDKDLILEANLAATTMLGLDRSSLVKQLFSNFILKEDQDIYYLHRKNFVETGESQVCQLRMMKKNGAIFKANLQATTGKNDDGEQVSRVVVVEDV